MGKKIFYCALSVGFFICLFLATVMISDLFFNSSSSFFDRMSDISSFFKRLGK